MAVGRPKKIVCLADCHGMHIPILPRWVIVFPPMLQKRLHHPMIPAPQGDSAGCRDYCLVLLDDTSFKSSHNCFGPVRHLVRVQEHHARDGLLTLLRQVFVSFEELFDIFWSEPAVDVCHDDDSRAGAARARPSAFLADLCSTHTPRCAKRIGRAGRRDGQEETKAPRRDTLQSCTRSQTPINMRQSE